MLAKRLQVRIDLQKSPVLEIVFHRVAQDLHRFFEDGGTIREGQRGDALGKATGDLQQQSGVVRDAFPERLGS